MITFSVVIPTYNRSVLVKDAIESVLKQTFSDYEIIVVDDGSTDNTGSIVKAYGDKICYLYQKNQGPGTARNYGINNAKGKYITFLDSDDLWCPWTLQILNEVIQSCDNPLFVCGKAVKSDEIEKIEGTSPKDIKYIKYKDYLSSSSDSIWIGTCSVAISKEVLKQVGCYESRHMNAEDSDLWLKLGTVSGFAFVNAPPLFVHRFTPDSEISNHKLCFMGLFALLETEKLGKYPGGLARRYDRWRIISRHIRPGSLTLLRHCHYHEAYTLYFRSFYMNKALGHWKYILGFWFVFLKMLITKNG